MEGHRQEGLHQLDLPVWLQLLLVLCAELAAVYILEPVQADRNPVELALNIRLVLRQDCLSFYQEAEVCQP